METNRKLKIFLCHASQDKMFAEEIYSRLTEEKWIDPWLDKKKLLAGVDWQQSIKVAIENADIVVIFLSNNSINKEGFIQKELRFAIDISLEKPDGSIFLVPVRLDECKVPEKLSHLQYVDYFEGNKEIFYGELLESFRYKYNQVIDLDGISSEINTKDIDIQKSVQPIKEILNNYLNGLGKSPKDTNFLTGIPSGFFDLDKMTLGLHSSRLWLVASRQTQNKTNFLISLISNASLRFNKRVAFFTLLGMSSSHVLNYLISHETGIELNRLIAEKILYEELDLIKKASIKLSETNIFVDDTPAITFEDFKQKVTKLVLEEKIDFIVIDNIQYMKAEDKITNLSKEMNYSELKVLAQKLNIPIIIGIGLPKTTSQRIDRRPLLSELNEFKSLEDATDTIIFVHHPEFHEKDFDNIGVAEIIVAKQDFGQTGEINLVFRNAIKKYENATVKVFKPNS